MMRIIFFLLLSILWFWWVYGMTLALVNAFKMGVAVTPLTNYSRQNQPIKFTLTVLVQVVFWVGLVFWWLNGLWNFLIKLFD